MGVNTRTREWRAHMFLSMLFSKDVNIPHPVSEVLLSRPEPCSDCINLCVNTRGIIPSFHPLSAKPCSQGA